jgi:hypothetical protein
MEDLPFHRWFGLTGSQPYERRVADARGRRAIFTLWILRRAAFYGLLALTALRIRNSAIRAEAGRSQIGLKRRFGERRTRHTGPPRLKRPRVRRKRRSRRATRGRSGLFWGAPIHLSAWTSDAQLRRRLLADSRPAGEWPSGQPGLGNDGSIAFDAKQVRH